MSSEASAAIIGAAVATLGVLLVEVLLKPAFARKRVTRVLLSELQLNSRLLRKIQEHRAANPDSVSESLHISDRGWQAIAQDLHYLPTKALNSLILLYGKYEEINQLVRDHSHKGDMIFQIGEGPQVKWLFAELQHAAAILDKSLPDALAHTERATTLLKQHLDEAIPDLLPDA